MRTKFVASNDDEETRFKAVDFEAATDVFISAFPGATLAEVHQRALGAAANCDLMGFPYEARVLRETAARLKARMTHGQRRASMLRAARLADSDARSRRRAEHKRPP